MYFLGSEAFGGRGRDGENKRGRLKYVNETSSLKIGAEGEARVSQRGPKPHLLRSPLPRVFIPSPQESHRGRAQRATRRARFRHRRRPQ